MAELKEQHLLALEQALQDQTKAVQSKMALALEASLKDKEIEMKKAEQQKLDKLAKAY